ncbi:restriction endonuclease [Fluviicola sp.]|uniref:5-methylcytosine restriction system specificity protein McrC n=1 Tax=Fluviicola sp. TaxID=1917219 RepID=UPI0031D7FF01
MITLPEQYGYKDVNELIDLSDFLDVPPFGNRAFSKRKGEGLCYKFWKDKDQNGYVFQTSYYVGVDWLIEGKKAIYVEPKQNDGEIQINYLKMLLDAFNENSDLKHLEELFEVDFDKPTIEIEQQQDLLTPLLVIQYFQLLKRIVRKGLRKSYYKVDRNLNSRVKGKVLINQTITKNLIKSKNTSTVCHFEEFGINSLENKILKKAFNFCRAILSNSNFDGDKLVSDYANFIQPALEQVDEEVNILDLRHIKPNPLYPEYEQSLKLAKIILKKYGYSISRISNQKILTPPFWIDMSKLFELYVYSKLKLQFPLPGEVIYHPSVNRLEPDFLIRSKDGHFVMVVDAKYKPQYVDNTITVDDARQISGYARLKMVYELLQESDMSKVIECLIIFSDQNSLDELDKRDFRSFPEKSYVSLYKIGVRLPSLI